MGACCIETDPPDLWHIIWRSARKEYRCCECAGTIAPGDAYERYTELSDGWWRTWITCEACADLRESLMDAWCPLMGELRDSYRDFLEETGRFRWSDDEERIIYPDNHFRLNDDPQ